jgi:hypothetical protein
MVEPLDLVARYLYSVTGGNEVSTSGFHADPEALSQLAAKFEQAARQLAEEAALFSGASQSARAGTFGSLPAARAAHRVYLQRTEEAHRGLRAIQDTLESDLAAGLRTAAGNYVAEDEASSAGSP